MAEDMRSVTYLKENAAALLAQVNRSQRPVVITQDGRPRAVLLAPRSFEQTRDALGLMKLIAQGEVDVREGRTLPQERVFATIEARLAPSRAGK
jgi:prevent-host-death family protein